MRMYSNRKNLSNFSIMAGFGTIRVPSNMPHFFEFPPTRSNRVKWALKELAVEYTSCPVDLRKAEQREASYQEIHPLGHVPAYRTEGYTMHESVAIVLQLVDEHPQQGLAPAVGTAGRAAYYQWCVFGCAELDPALSDVMLHTMHLPVEQRVAAIELRARERFAARAVALSKALTGQEYILGDAFSAADIVLGYCCNWAAYTGVLKDHPQLVAYFDRLRERPAFKAVFETS